MNNQKQEHQVGVRVNGAMMSQYVGRYVTLVGKVAACEGSNIVHIETCDGMNVACTIMDGNKDFQGCEGVSVEMKGMVDNLGNLNVQQYFGFTDVITPDGKTIAFDMSTYNNLLNLAHGPFRDMFDPDSVHQDIGAATATATAAAGGGNK